MREQHFRQIILIFDFGPLFGFGLVKLFVSCPLEETNLTSSCIFSLIILMWGY